MITEYCYYCRKETETLEIKGGDCKICGLSKVTPKDLGEKMKHEGGKLDDSLEWDETLGLLEDGEELVASELSFGEFISIKKKLFEKMIEEINSARIEKGNLEEGVDLIIISEELDENIKESDED